MKGKNLMKSKCAWILGSMVVVLVFALLFVALSTQTQKPAEQTITSNKKLINLPVKRNGYLLLGLRVEETMIDSCEYLIVRTPTGNHFTLTHKGNCQRCSKGKND
jgi:hypothetical protein